MPEPTFSDYSQELRSLYNRATPREFNPEQDYASRRLGDLLEYARLNSTTRILDLGCGTGWAGVLLTRDYPKRRYEGLDLAYRSIQVANQLRQDYGLYAQTTFRFLDVAEARYAPESFDLVVCSSALPLFASWQKILERVYQWLSPEGQLLCSTYEPDSFFNAQIKASAQEVFGVSLPDVKEVLGSVAQAKEILTQIGFRKVVTVRTNYDRLRVVESVTWDGTWIHPDNPLRNLSAEKKKLLSATFGRKIQALALRQALAKQVPDETKVLELRRHLYTQASK